MTYEFTCRTCGLTFSKNLPMSADHSGVRCPSGHHDVRRVYSVPAVQFKGSGFYSTDHRSDSPSKSSGG